MLFLETLKYELHFLNNGKKTGKILVTDENSLNAILLFADQKKDKDLNTVYTIGKTKFIILQHINKNH